MGQRLVVSIVQDQKTIAAIYYHWSAYSLSALEETRNILDCLLDDENEIKDLRLRLIRFCERNGGCIKGGGESTEYHDISMMYPDENFKEDGSRNEGLIALTEEGISDLESWSEGDVTINLDSETIYNSVIYEETFDEYEENGDSINTLKVYNAPDLFEIKFDELDEAIMFIDELEMRMEWSFLDADTVDAHVVYSLIA